MGVDAKPYFKTSFYVSIYMIAGWIAAAVYTESPVFIPFIVAQFFITICHGLADHG
jgi:hypothetical protein